MTGVKTLGRSCSGGHARRTNAMAWLERLYSERGAWIRGLKVQPVWDPLGRSALQDLLRRARLAD